MPVETLLTAAFSVGFYFLFAMGQKGDDARTPL